MTIRRWDDDLDSWIDDELSEIDAELIYRDFPSFEPAQPEPVDIAELDAYRLAASVARRARHRFKRPEDYKGVPFTCYRERVIASNPSEFGWLARKPLYINNNNI